MKGGRGVKGGRGAEAGVWRQGCEDRGVETGGVEIQLWRQGCGGGT